MSQVDAKSPPAGAPERPTDPPPAPPRNRRRHLWTLGAFVFYFAFACYLTWPVILHLGGTFYAQNPPGDPIGGMATFRELVDHHLDPFLPGTISQFAGPEGLPITWTLNLGAVPSVLSQYVLTGVFGQVAAYDLYLLVAYALTGTVMFAFVRRLTDNTWVALICGWAFAFYPFAVLNGQGHVDYVQGWVLVLAVWRMIELHWLPNRRNAILAGLAIALAMWWTPYFILLTGVAYAAYLVAVVLIALRDRGAWRTVLRYQAITAGIVVVFLAFLGVLARKASNGSQVRTNSLAEFNAYSARPLEYLIPDGHSPVFGSDTSTYLTTHLHGSNPVEATLYLGVTIILLAVVALIACALRRLPGSLRRAVFILAVIALAAIISSAPPDGTVLGVTIPFPSHFIMKITSTWRAYSRFVVIVMLAFTTLAGVGLAFLVRRVRAPWTIVIMLAATVLIPLDLWARLPGNTAASSRTVTYSVPAVYKVLARQPKGLTAEYPLVPFGYNFYVDIFYQNVHGMPMLNGYAAGTLQEHRALSLANLAAPSTAPRLAALGVRYVILESGPTPYNLPSAGIPRRGFRLIYHSRFANLYVVTARPAAPALAAAGNGFGDDEPTSTGGLANWLEAPSGTIGLAGQCNACTGVLRMTLAPFTRARTVTISAGGKTLLVRRITRPTPVALPLAFRSKLTLTIAATPGPQSIQKTIGGPDTRSVSVYVSGLSFHAR